MSLRFAVQSGGNSGLAFADQNLSIGAQPITGSGILAAQSAAVAGAGSVNGEFVGTGTLAAQNAAASGVGERSIVDIGTIVELEAQRASVNGSGSVGSEVTGTGTFAAQSATASGAGEREITGTGAPAAQNTAVNGTGTSSDADTVTGGGAVAAQSISVSGTGEIVKTGFGGLAAQSSAVSGSGDTTGSITILGSVVANSISPLAAQISLGANIDTAAVAASITANNATIETTPSYFPSSVALDIRARKAFLTGIPTGKDVMITDNSWDYVHTDLSIQVFEDWF